MKPLPVAPLTPEDRVIWLRAWDRVQGTPGAFTAIRYIARTSDRRDAAQMFERMKWQAEGFEQGYDWRTERRGWFPSDWGRASDEYLNPL
jgi:hypothetical protein